MKDRLRLTILGCGSSPGTPRVTGDWGACDPNEPRNRRTRCSALVERISEKGRTTIVIDCGPDFREQMLSANVRHIDAVIITHPHADHIHGLDDLRGFFLDSGRRIDLYADQSTYSRLKEAFAYCFRSPPGSSYPPIVEWQRIQPLEPFAIKGAAGELKFLPFEQRHGSIHSLGLRIGQLAYCSDVSDFPIEAQQAIAGADMIVVDALQYHRHPSHLSIEQALAWIKRLGIPQAVLTHMHTPLDYQTLRRELPGHIEPAYDGMVIEFELPEMQAAG